MYEVKRIVKSSIKDANLIEARRQQMIRSAVKLFKVKGFHRTTTREIATEAGFSIGTLYEYIRKKEDILFLICDGIYEEVHHRLVAYTDALGTIESVKKGIHAYYTLVDNLSDEFVVMYQESKSLPKDALQYVLEKELEMVRIFEEILTLCVASGALRIRTKDIELTAHHIVVQGQMWAFRSWALSKKYSIDTYIKHQQNQLLKGLIKG